MDLGREFPIAEERKEEDYQIQGAWIPATPAKQGSQVSRTTNWLESLGLPPELSRETPSANGATACIPFVDLLALTSGGASVDSSSLNANLKGSHNVPSSSFSPNGNPVHRRDYDLNLPPITMANCISNGAVSIQFAPVTPDKDQRIENQLSERVDLSVVERSYGEQDKQEVLITPNRLEIIDLNSGEWSQPNEVIELQTGLSHPLVGTSAAVSTTLTDNQNLEKAGNHGIDLNMTPQQKPKRKKHRPKVVAEGKPKRTPKPMTPNQASDKENPSGMRKYVRKYVRKKSLKASQNPPAEAVREAIPSRDNQNPSGMRKYVRKKRLKASETPSAEAVGEAIDPSPSSTMKSCKRVLNFNLEDQGRDEHMSTSLNNQERFLHNSVESSSSRWIFNLNSESQAQDLSNGIDGGSGTKSTLQLGQGIEVIVSNTSSGIAYDLSCSLNQVIKDYISLPETSPAPQSTKRDPPTQSSNCLPKNRNEMEKPSSSLSNGESSHTLIHQNAQAEEISHMVLPTRATLVHDENFVQSLLQCGSQSMSKCQKDPNSNLCVPFVENNQARGSKREYFHTIDKTHAQTINMRRDQHNSLQAYQEIPQENGYYTNNFDLSFPEIFKKKRTKKAQHTTPRSSSSTAANRVGRGQEWQSYHGTADTQYNNILSTKRPKNGINKSAWDVFAHSMAMENFPGQDSTIDPLSPSRETFAKLQASGFMLNFGLTERTTKKRSKGSTRVRDLTSLTATVQCNQLISTPQKTARTSGGRQGADIVHRPQACLEALISENHPKKKRTRKGTPPVNSIYFSINQPSMQEKDAAMYDQHQPTAMSRGQPEVTQPNMVTIDEIVQRWKHLDINGESNRIPNPEQNALVPYNGNGAMVPYEGLFHPTIRRRPRPKVDLDPETDRVWKLLMGKPGSEGMEQMDNDEEKWWEERRVFQGRADSFIARMHLVQGDRRFSQWKGSVLDSVVGVFLTQNVSDHLSSSAFMSLAARFPLQSKNNKQACCKEGITTSLEEPEVCMPDTQDTIKLHENMPSQLVCDQSSMFHEAGHIEQEVANSYESFGSNMGDGSSTDNSRGKDLPVCSSPGISRDLLPNRTERLTKKIGMVNFIREDKRALEDGVSSQNTTESSTFQITERNGSCSESNSEAEDPVTQSPSKPSSNGLDSCTFIEVPQMGRSTMFQEFNNCGSGSSSINQSPMDEQNQSKGIDCLKDSSAYIHPSGSHLSHKQLPIIHSSTYSLHVTPNSGVLEVQCPEMLGEKSRCPLPSSASEITRTKHVNSTSKQDALVRENVSETVVQKASSSAQENPPAGLYGYQNKHQTQTLYSLLPETYSVRNPKSFNHQSGKMEAFQSENTILGEPTNPEHKLAGRQTSGMHQVSSSRNFSEVLDAERGCLADQGKCRENKLIQSNLKNQVYVSDNSATGSTKNLKAKKMETEKKKKFDWDSLRKQVYANGGKKERSSNTMDSLDWEAVRCANVNEIASAIKERGMNNVLAERIKDFLDRLVREHGSIDLEWLRDVPPDQVKEYLLSIRGLGLKSVECVRLLTLHHLAFPVDTNVGRIAVRLGWVPLQPLPESLQLHLLEMYPVQESIQKYLWPRLCTLDQRTLYELHYQMITFGKVFCTKSKPNCNACPMRGECKHFASAFASARFALPAPEEKSIVSSTVPVVAEDNPTLGINNQMEGSNTMLLPLPDANPLVAAPENEEKGNCEPIVEVPATPEPECTEILQSDIEDFLDDDPDEIPTIKLDIEEFTMNLQNYMHEYSMELQKGDMSQALVALTPEAASIPVPKLKNVSRLRTEHQVYELPDSHPLLEELDKREPDDPCSYLLAIWTPGEIADSIQPPKSSCGYQESGKVCNEKACFSCNSVREANSQTVRGTLLIPCRTAMRGSFPLNGTYFQVNEVFADHDSSLNPIDVPRAWLWNLPRRTVYFGTSIPTIFRGLTTEGIQHCFWRGFEEGESFNEEIILSEDSDNGIEGKEGGWKKIDEQLESMKLKEMGYVAHDGPSLGKKSFGSGNGRTSPPEDYTERNWRKTDTVDAPTQRICLCKGIRPENPSATSTNGQTTLSSKQVGQDKKHREMKSRQGAEYKANAKS